MKLAALSLAFTALVAGTAAQSLADLPQCARQCANDAIPQQCGLDVKCICSTQSFISSIACCVSKSCDAADQATTIKFANSICATAGITGLPQSADCTSSSQSSTAPVSSGTGASSTTASTSGSTPASTSSHTSSGSASAASPSGTSAAAPIVQTQNGGVVAGVGAAAIFAAMLLA